MNEMLIVAVVVGLAALVVVARLVRAARRSASCSPGCSGCSVSGCPDPKQSRLPVLAFIGVLAGPASGGAVGGISGAKVVAPNAHTVPENVLELEPYVGIGWTRSGFDDQWQRHSADRRTTATESGFRFTAGVLPSVEVGLMVPLSLIREDDGQGTADLGDIPLGAKWRFFSSQSLCIAATGGVTIPTGSSSSPLATGDGLVVMETGVIATWQLSEQLSIDADLIGGYGLGVSDNPDEWGAAADLAIGYQWPQLQPVLELNYVLGSDGSSHLVALTAGFTYDLNERVIIVTGVQADLLGRDESAGFAYSLAITTSI